MSDVINNVTDDTKKVQKSMKDFFILWFGQLVSIIGSGLTGFALGVWVYQKTGSVTYFSLIILFTTLPGILIRPFSGVFADKYSRKAIMLISDFGASLATLFIAVLFWLNELELWHIYIAMGISSICNGFQSPAYQASISQLVPKTFYAQASGMMQAASSSYYLISPVLAGFLFGVIGITGIIIIDFATFIFAALTMIIIKLPRLIITSVGKGGQGSILNQLHNTFIFLRKYLGLLLIILVLALCNFFLGFLTVLISPMILIIANPALLGLGQSISAVGMLLSSIYVSIFGINKNLVRNLFIFLLIQGLAYSLIGFRANFLTIVIPCFFFFLTLPVTNTCIETLLRKKVVPDMQGRIFALVGMFAQASLILSYIIAGPLADFVFEPLFQEGGLLVHTIGKIIGIGGGRGIGFLFIIAGFFIILLSMFSYLIPKIRYLEKEVPDAVKD